MALAIMKTGKGAFLRFLSKPYINNNDCIFGMSNNLFAFMSDLLHAGHIYQNINRVSVFSFLVSKYV